MEEKYDAEWGIMDAPSLNMLMRKAATATAACPAACPVQYTCLAVAQKFDE